MQIYKVVAVVVDVVSQTDTHLCHPCVIESGPQREKAERGQVLDYQTIVLYLVRPCEEN